MYELYEPSNDILCYHWPCSKSSMVCQNSPRVCTPNTKSQSGDSRFEIKGYIWNFDWPPHVRQPIKTSDLPHHKAAVSPAPLIVF